MIDALFGDVARGRVDGLGYLGYTVLLTLALFALVFVLSFVLMGLGGGAAPAMPPAGAPGGHAAQEASGRGRFADTPSPSVDAPTGQAPAGPQAEAASMPAMMVAVPLIAAYFFAVANLGAKRIRDMGLPGWPGAGLLALLGILLSVVFSGAVAGGFHLLASLGLILVPTDAFRGPKSGPGGLGSGAG